MAVITSSGRRFHSFGSAIGKIVLPGICTHHRGSTGHKKSSVLVLPLECTEPYCGYAEVQAFSDDVIAERWSSEMEAALGSDMLVYALET